MEVMCDAYTCAVHHRDLSALRNHRNLSDLWMSNVVLIFEPSI